MFPWEGNIGGSGFELALEDSEFDSFSSHYDR